jgi:hypothetical protein
MDKFKNWIEEVSKCNNRQLAKEHGHVYQIWEDGEITLQKSGDLLWMRGLHTIQCGLGFAVDSKLMPEKTRDHGYAFVTEEDAERLRNLLLEISKS